MEMPRMRDILLLRKNNNKEVNEAYVYFCEKFIKHVVGVQSFNRAWKNNASITELATPSDEALALLLLENSLLRWTAEFDKVGRGEVVTKDDKQLPKPLYTSSNNHRGELKGFTRRYGGWSDQGIARFNELYKMVRDDRVKHSSWFDEIMAKRISAIGEEEVGGNQAQNLMIKADNDLFCGNGNDETKSSDSCDNEKYGYDRDI